MPINTQNFDVPASRRSGSKQRGMMMLVNLVAVMLMGLLFAFLLNTGIEVTEKTERQGAADPAAYAAGLWKTRSLNAISGTNHVMGEMLAMVVVHHALGGDLLDERSSAERAKSHWSKLLKKKSKKLNKLNSDLDTYSAEARGLGAKTPAYRTVRQRRGVRAEATLLDAKMELKELLVGVYQKKIAAKLMQKYPPTAAAGRALEAAMDILEIEILAEYQFLNGVHRAAESLLETKFQLRDRALPDAKQYTVEIVKDAPRIIQRTVQEVAERHGATKGLVLDPQLPVVIDPAARALSLPRTSGPFVRPNTGCPSEKTNIGRDQARKASQLTRATAPWVFYHRQPLWDALARFAPLSGAGDFYKDYSDGYTKVLSGRYQMDRHDLGLFVLDGYDAPDKGYAEWTSNELTADKQFGTLVVVYTPPRFVIGRSVFGQHHEHGQITYAEALSYNANPQQPHPGRIDLTTKRITPNRQANVGWDTLNWRRPAWELVAKTDQCGAPTPEFPDIRLNWQTKLVPTTAQQLKMLKSSSVPTRMRPVVRMLLDNTPEALLAH